MNVKNIVKISGRDTMKSVFFNIEIRIKVVLIDV